MRDATVTALPLGPTLDDDDVPSLLRAADRLIARALEALTTQRRCLSGASEEMVLRLEGRRARWDARELATAASLLDSMPKLRAAFHQGLVSWSQVRAITRNLRPVREQDRAGIDTLIAREAFRLRDADPEVLLDLIDTEVDQIRVDLATRREQHAIDRSFLVLQPRADGSGGMIYGETDTEGFTAIAEAIETAAPSPSDEPGERARQRMDALIGICEQHLAGSSPGTRPRPRLLATIDLADLIELGASESARVLWQVTGRRGRITPLATRLWACDTDITPIIFQDTSPSASATHARPSHPRSEPRSSHAIKAAASTAATHPQAGPTPTTSSLAAKAAQQRSPTSSCSADAATAASTTAAGASPSNQTRR